MNSMFETAIERRFPHVATRIVDTWGTAAFPRYLRDLIMTARPNRRGFPEDVALELLLLEQVFEIAYDEGLCQHAGALLQLTQHLGQH